MLVPGWTELRIVASVGVLGSLPFAGRSSLAAQRAARPHASLAAGQAVRGWTILSDSEPEDRAVIAAAKAYHINHLELSHQVVMNLRELRDEGTRALVNRLTNAHHAGIQEVVVWDHALYDLAYYPQRFRTGPGGTLDFDARGERYRTPDVTRAVTEGLREIVEVSAAVRAYPDKPPKGQWEWVSDADRALQYREWITSGWPRETHGFANPQGGVVFTAP